MSMTLSASTSRPRSLLSIASGGLIFGGATHTIGPASAQTANITGGNFADNYTVYVTANNGGTDGATGGEWRDHL